MASVAGSYYPIGDYSEPSTSKRPMNPPQNMSSLGKRPRSPPQTNGLPPTPTPSASPIKKERREREKGKGRQREQQVDLTSLYADPPLFYSSVLPNLPMSAKKVVLNELEKYLPLVTEDTFSFGEVVERVLARLWEELHAIKETWPGMTDKEKKGTLLNWTLNLRRQCLKLIVLSKWAHSASQETARCMNIIAFIEKYMQHMSDVSTFIEACRQSFATGRSRPYDIQGALELGITGNYSRGMPGVYEAFYKQPSKLSKAQILSLFDRLDDIIRDRLRNEVLPLPMRNYVIHSGKAWFELPGLAKFCASLSGGEREDRWYLFGLQFEFEVKSGEKRWNRKVEGRVLDNVRQVADVEMAPRFVPPLNRVGEVTEDRRWKDTPLVRLWNFIVTLTYEYRMRALHAQALILEREHWKSHIRVEMSRDFRMLTVHYWTRSNLDISQGPKTTLPLALPTQGKIQIHLRERLYTNSTVFLKRGTHSDLTGHLQSLLTRRQRSREAENWVMSDYPKNKEMVIIWSAERVPQSLLEEKLEFDENFSLEDVLREVTRRHASWIVEKEWWELFVRDGPALGFATSDGNRQGNMHLKKEAGKRSYIELGLKKNMVLHVSVESVTGRVDMSVFDEENVGEAGGLKCIKSLEEANGNRLLLTTLALQLKIQCIREDVECKTLFLGLETHLRLPVQPEELSKLGTQPARFHIFVSLAHFSMYYLVIMMTDEKLRYGLVHLQQTLDSEGRMGLGIESVTWMEFADNVDKFDMSIESLLQLYKYSLFRVSMNQVETQLASRGISWTLVSSQYSLSPKSDGPRDISSFYPVFRIDNRSLFSPPKKVRHMVADRSLLLVKMLDDDARSFEIGLHIKLNHLLVPSDTSWLPSNASMDRNHSIISVRSRNLEKCVFELLTTLSPIFRTVIALFQETHPHPYQPPTCLVPSLHHILTYHPPNSSPDASGPQTSNNPAT